MEVVSLFKGVEHSIKSVVAILAVSNRRRVDSMNSSPLGTFGKKIFSSVLSKATISRVRVFFKPYFAGA